MSAAQLVYVFGMHVGNCTVIVAGFDEGNVLVTIYHDESTFQSNDDQSLMWAQPDQTALKPKVSKQQNICLYTYRNLSCRAEGLVSWSLTSSKSTEDISSTMGSSVSLEINTINYGIDLLFYL